MTSHFKVLVDKETGVNYLFHTEKFPFGDSIEITESITPLLDKDGKPVVTPVGK